MTDATELDEASIRETWLRQCGPCDAGLPMACVCSDADPRPVIERLLAALGEARAEVAEIAATALTIDRERMAAESAHRDLVSRLGFGDGITEPMADNDTVVAWLDVQASEASEWRESQRWRDECVLAGHSDDEDCYEHDPARRLEAAESALAAVRALADEWEDLINSPENGIPFWIEFHAALATPTTPETTTEGDR